MIKPTRILLVALLVAGCDKPVEDVPLTLRIIRGDADPLRDPGTADLAASEVDTVMLELRLGADVQAQSVPVTDRRAALRLVITPPFEGKLVIKGLRAADDAPYSLGRLNALSVPADGASDVAVFMGPLDAFTPVGLPLAGPRVNASVAALGRRGALIVGGHLTTSTGVELASPSLLVYDHAAGRTCGAAESCVSGDLPAPRTDAIAVRLTDGSVLHGLGRLADGTLEGSLWLTQEQGATSRLTGTMPGRTGAAAVALADGSALIFGGSDGTAPTQTVFRVDARAGAVTPQPSMLHARSRAGAVLLSTGQTFIAGGVGTLGPLASAEVYTVGQGAELLDGGAFAQARKTMRGARAAPQLGRMGDDSVLIFGGGVGPEVFRLELGPLVGGLVDLSPPPAGKIPEAPTMMRLQSGELLLVGGEAVGSPSPLALRFTPTPNQVLGPQSTTYLGAYRTVGAASSLRGRASLVELADGAVLVVGGGTAGETAAAVVNPPAPRVEVLVPGPP